jgi:hypothetical protein
MKNSLSLACCALMLTCLLASCRQKVVMYSLVELTDSTCLQLTRWSVLGVLPARDTLQERFLGLDHMKEAGLSDDGHGLTEGDFCKTPYIFTKGGLAGSAGPITVRQVASSEPIIDIATAFSKKGEPFEPAKGAAVYLSAQLASTVDETVFLTTRSSNGIKVWLNGDSIYHSYEFKGFEMTASEFLPLRLKKGLNQLVIKRVNHGLPWLFEGKLCRRPKLAEAYQLKTTHFLLSNPLAGDSLFLLSNPAKDLDTTLHCEIRDLDGNVQLAWTADTASQGGVNIQHLKPQAAYVFQFRAGNRLFMHPFYVGDPDLALVNYRAKALKHFGPGYDTCEVGSYLFRLAFLLDHPSRKDDWWWSFKVAAVLVELDRILNNFEKQQSLYQHSFGIQYRTYRSNVDDSLQRYLLIQPYEVDPDTALPLVVVIRPFIENLHPFLASPQLARYWSLTYATYLANTYHVTIMMPEARMSLNEPMDEAIESDILQAIEHVQAAVKIDKQRIFLHGNCSAGFRCLMLACRHPELFAAVGLYAPVYEMKARTAWESASVPKEHLKQLSHTPMALHYDPLDTHSPYRLYEALVKDAKRQRLPLKVSHSDYSGLHFNVLLVGDEMFQFFKQVSIEKH